MCTVRLQSLNLLDKEKTRRKQSCCSHYTDSLRSNKQIWMCLVCFTNIQWKRVYLPVLQAGTLVSTGHSKHPESNCRDHLGILALSSPSESVLHQHPSKWPPSVNVPQLAAFSQFFSHKNLKPSANLNFTILSRTLNNNCIWLFQREWRHRLYQVSFRHSTASFSIFPGHLVKILTCECWNGIAAMGSKRIAGLFKRNIDAKRYELGQKEYPTNIESHLYNRNACFRLNNVKWESERRNVISFGSNGSLCSV